MAEFSNLPEGCIAAILSRTSPVDAGILTLVSKTFRSAADSDAIWNHFLPSNSHLIDSVISQSPSLANAPTKKALYLALSRCPIIIDNGQKSFQLDRKSGKICYMLAARSLAIVWGDTPRYWNWISMPHSRFPEVAELLNVCWLEIHGNMNTIALSPNTRYAAYVVFKMNNARGFKNRYIELSIDIAGDRTSTKSVCLDPNAEDSLYNSLEGSQRPSVRNDGWFEMEMGEFFTSALGDDEVQLNIWGIKGGNWKSGLFLQGLEVRPK